MPSRRAFVAGSLALTACPALATKAPPAPKVGAIHWPGPGRELHGYMAVPGKAHGRQPAVLVVHDVGGADSFSLGLADALALAGFVACVPKALASLDDAVATVRWLATNPYATGKVAAVGLGWGGALVERIAAASDSLLCCGVSFGSGDDAISSSVPILRLPALRADTDKEIYAGSWQQAVGFLSAQLEPTRR